MRDREKKKHHHVRREHDVLQGHTQVRLHISPLAHKIHFSFFGLLSSLFFYRLFTRLGSVITLWDTSAQREEKRPKIPLKILESPFQIGRQLDNEEEREKKNRPADTEWKLPRPDEKFPVRFSSLYSASLLCVHTSVRSRILRRPSTCSKVGEKVRKRLKDASFEERDGMGVADVSI